MSTFTNYLIVILIALIILLTFTYSSDYLHISIPFIQNDESSENLIEEKVDEKFDEKVDNINIRNNNFNKIEKTENIKNNNFNKIEKTENIKNNYYNDLNKVENADDINNFLIDTNFGTIDSDNLNKELFLQTDEYQMTENTNNAIYNALQNI
jgi:hypothetical protein